MIAKGGNIGEFGPLYVAGAGYKNLGMRIPRSFGARTGVKIVGLPYKSSR